MSLLEYFEALPKEKKILQLGIETDTPLANAFPYKRVVHPGLNGTLVPPKDSQNVWDKLMKNIPKKGQIQAAYIHIPFCRTKCTYCHFFINPNSKNIEDQYINFLIKEMQMASDSPRLKNGLIHSVFIGGGTPTSLTPENSEKLLKAIRKYLPLANDYELTLEGRIHDIIPEKTDIWMSNGVNRISLGVQSFDTKVRKLVGRLDSQDVVLERLSALMEYAQCSVVIDLMYGLPGQTMNIWEKDLSLLVASGIDGADLYQLNVFEDSDLNRQIQSGQVPPAATTAQQSEMFSFGRSYLMKRAYRRISNCHWSRSNRERSLYNHLAASGATMFPFGSGAGGSIDGYTTMLYRVLKPYEAMIELGKKPFMGLIRQPKLQPIIYQILSELDMNYLNIDAIAKIDSRISMLHELYQFWEQRGLVKYNGILYSLTEAGEFWNINIGQSTLEALEHIMTGETSFVMDKVAAQDTSEKDELMKKAMDKALKMGGSSNTESMKRMAEAMKKLSADDLKDMMNKML